jgi:hypothetical protein
MLPGYSRIVQALMGTLLTWGLTAAGAAVVFLVPRGMSERRMRLILDIALGFAAGVMLAASYWSLLAPAIEFAEETGVYGAFVFIPVSIGFLAGGAFVVVADRMLPGQDTVAVLSSKNDDDDDDDANDGQNDALDEAEWRAALQLPEGDANSSDEDDGNDDDDDDDDVDDMDVMLAAFENVGHHDVVFYDGNDDDDDDEEEEDDDDDDEDEDASESDETPVRQRVTRASARKGRAVPRAAATKANGRRKAAATKAAVTRGKKAARARPFETTSTAAERARSWRRILLLVVAIT